ncbi:MAG: CBS domain-containing protein [Desulfarculus sp.]|nr:MAG: CBS domain-containing protein [Desulfarculus sp.]
MREIPGYLDITPEDFRQVYARAYAHALERVRRGLPAERVMTREAAAVAVDTPLTEVARIMAQRRVSGVPVLQGGRVVGLISEKDFLDAMGAQGGRHFMEVVAQCLGQGPCLAAPLRAATAGELMSAPAVVAGPETSTSEIAEIMGQKGINRVPVVDSQGRLLGIVSRADLLRAGGPA